MLRVFPLLLAVFLLSACPNVQHFAVPHARAAFPKLPPALLNKAQFQIETCLAWLFEDISPDVTFAARKDWKSEPATPYFPHRYQNTSQTGEQAYFASAFRQKGPSCTLSLGTRSSRVDLRPDDGHVFISTLRQAGFIALNLRDRRRVTFRRGQQLLTFSGQSLGGPWQFTFQRQ